MTRLIKLSLLSALVAGTLTGCATATTGPPAGAKQTSPSTRDCPVGNGGTAMIDYVDFVHYQGRSYTTQVMTPLPANEPQPVLGAQVATVRCELSKIQPVADYVTRDDDAGFLPAGTRVYAVGGYPPSFRLTALRDGRYRIYEVDTAPRARTGRDLLPIAGLVRRIDVLDANTATRVLATISESREIGRLVGALVAAPVNQDRQVALATYFLRFQLADGSSVTRAWHAKESVVERGILVPRSFTTALQHRMAKR